MEYPFLPIGQMTPQQLREKILHDEAEDARGQKSINFKTGSGMYWDFRNILDRERLGRVSDVMRDLMARFISEHQETLESNKLVDTVKGEVRKAELKFSDHALDVDIPDNVIDAIEIYARKHRLSNREVINEIFKRWVKEQWMRDAG